MHRAEFDADNELALSRNVFEDVSLESTQHVRSEKVVQPLDLLLLANVRKRLQETLKVTARSLKGRTHTIMTESMNLRL